MPHFNGILKVFPSIFLTELQLDRIENDRENYIHLANHFPATNPNASHSNFEKKNRKLFSKCFSCDIIAVVSRKNVSRQKMSNDNLANAKAFHTISEAIGSWITCHYRKKRTQINFSQLNELSVDYLQCEFQTPLLCAQGLQQSWQFGA